jgi:hypothetical protein
MYLPSQGPVATFGYCGHPGLLLAAELHDGPSEESCVLARAKILDRSRAWHALFAHNDELKKAVSNKVCWLKFRFRLSTGELLLSEPRVLVVAVAAEFRPNETKISTPPPENRVIHLNNPLTDGTTTQANAQWDDDVTQTWLKVNGAGASKTWQMRSDVVDNYWFIRWMGLVEGEILTHRAAHLGHTPAVLDQIVVEQ